MFYLGQIRRLHFMDKKNYCSNFITPQTLFTHQSTCQSIQTAVLQQQEQQQQQQNRCIKNGYRKRDE